VLEDLIGVAPRQSTHRAVAAMRQFRRPRRGTQLDDLAGKLLDPIDVHRRTAGGFSRLLLGESRLTLFWDDGPSAREFD
jgi:hypothetical protein